MVSEASWLKLINIVTSREQPEIRGEFGESPLEKEYNLFKDYVWSDISRVIDFELSPRDV